MKEEHIELGPVPSEEDCVQVGDTNYAERAFAECRRYKELLVEKFGNPPEGRFSIRANRHDFGAYYEVAIYFNPESEESIDFAFMVENSLPARWDDSLRDDSLVIE